MSRPTFDRYKDLDVPEYKRSKRMEQFLAQGPSGSPVKPIVTSTQNSNGASDMINQMVLGNANAAEAAAPWHGPLDPLGE